MNKLYFFIINKLCLTIIETEDVIENVIVAVSLRHQLERLREAHTLWHPSVYLHASSDAHEHVIAAARLGVHSVQHGDYRGDGQGDELGDDALRSLDGRALEGEHGGGPVERSQALAVRGERLVVVGDDTLGYLLVLLHLFSHLLNCRGR